MEFTHELARQSPERFVQEVFVETLHVCDVVVGRDMRFGHRNSGDVSTLRELGARHGFDVLLIEDLGSGRDGTASPDQAHPSGRRWSSTWTRDLLREGDVAAAAEVLGRPHRVTGIVVHGDHRGRELGYPTANLAQDAEGMVPADGVYAGWLTRVDRPAPTEGGSAGAGEGLPMPAAISVGTNPTFDGHERRVEAYVLDRTDLDLYGARVCVDFVRRLRPTLRFDGIGPLVAQMALDVEQCREALGARRFGA
jgi:riboflavin kinase/FMN adenylyltransferase